MDCMVIVIESHKCIAFIEIMPSKEFRDNSEFSKNCKKCQYTYLHIRLLSLILYPFDKINLDNKIYF